MKLRIKIFKDGTQKLQYLSMACGKKELWENIPVVFEGEDIIFSNDGLKLDESYESGDQVKVIANDGNFGAVGFIYQRVPDSTRRDLYMVTFGLNGQRLYAGCSLQLIERGNDS